jgi:DNA replication protein DnaC
MPGSRIRSQKGQSKAAKIQNSAHFPWVKGFGDFDFIVIQKSPKQKLLSLAGGSFIRDRENIICIGAAGTGKTHTLIALGVAAIDAGYKVRFIKTIDYFTLSFNAFPALKAGAFDALIFIASPVAGLRPSLA